MSAPPDAPPDIADADADGKDAGGSGLTFPQIAAGALAAATASILGSFLGVLGTIGGAAAASIVSTVGAALYQRSLERTRDKVKERLVVTPAGTQVAAAVARVTGQGRAGGSGRSAPLGARPGPPGMPAAGGGPGRGLPNGPGPRPPGPGPFPPAPPRRGPAGEHADRGRPLPPEQQLRAGGRTVVTQAYAQGAPTRVGPPMRTPQGGIPAARATGTPPGGIPPTARMTPLGPPGPGGPPGPPGGDDAATQLTHVVHEGEARPKRFGKRTWLTMAGVAASVFVIGVLASFGVESATGHPLSGGESGTSVGSLFGQNTGTATPTTEPSTTEAPSSGSEETTSSDANDQPSGSQEPTGSSRQQDGSSQETTQRRSPSQDSGGSSNGGGGGLVPSLLPRFGNDGSTNG